MSTPTETPAAPIEPAEGTPAPAKTYDEDYVGGLRREAGGYRTKLRETETALETARREADEAKASVPALSTRAEAAEHRALLLEVALEKGLSVTHVGRLRGSTRAEIEADADDLMELVNPATPRGPLDYGAGSTETPAATRDSKADANAALRALFNTRR